MDFYVVSFPKWRAIELILPLPVVRFLYERIKRLFMNWKSRDSNRSNVQVTFPNLFLLIDL
jgi:hypothetical protein